MTNLRPALFVLAAAVCAAQSATEITLPGTRIFPESITSTADGAIIIGSVGNGNILRVPAGKTQAEEWIKAGTGGLIGILGVFADEKGGLLWVCSNDLQARTAPATVKTFDLKSGAPKDTYTLPGTGGFCNDIAVADDGSAYIADTNGGSIAMLKKGSKTMETIAKDALLAGADGLAFGDKTTLYVNSVSTGKLLRIDLDGAGKSKGIVDLKLSRTLTGPDGMRAIGPHKLLLAENAGRMSVITFDAAHENATVTTVKEGLTSTPAVTYTRGMGWIVEGKLNMRNDPKSDPGAFKLYSAPLPK